MAFPRLRGALPFLAACLAAGSALAYPATAIQDLNLRAGGGVEFEIIDVIDGGDVVDVMDCLEGWCQLSYEGQIGFASAAYLSGASRAAVGPRVYYAPAPDYYYDDYDYPAGVSLFLFQDRPFYWRGNERIFVYRRDRDDDRRRVVIRRDRDDDDRRIVIRRDRDFDDGDNVRRIRRSDGTILRRDFDRGTQRVVIPRERSDRRFVVRGNEDRGQRRVLREARQDRREARREARIERRGPPSDATGAIVRRRGGDNQILLRRRDRD